MPGTGEAGVTCYYDENSFLTLGVREGKIEATERIGLETRRHDTALAVQPGQRLHLAIRADGLTRILSVDGEDVLTLRDVTYLADEGVRLGKRFTGAMAGVYAVGCTADLTDLHYAEEDEA